MKKILRLALAGAFFIVSQGSAFECDFKRHRVVGSDDVYTEATITPSESDGRDKSKAGLDALQESFTKKLQGLGTIQGSLSLVFDVPTDGDDFYDVVACDAMLVLLGMSIDLWHAALGGAAGRIVALHFRVPGLTQVPAIVFITTPKECSFDSANLLEQETASFLSHVQATDCKIRGVQPAQLFKIVSKHEWQTSQGQENIILPDNDEEFIHFSLPDQVERIEQKYRERNESFVKLTINTAQLPGNWKFEVNPGRDVKYWHLYNGCIPMAAVAANQLFDDIRDID